MKDWKVQKGDSKSKFMISPIPPVGGPKQPENIKDYLSIEILKMIREKSGLFEIFTFSLRTAMFWPNLKISRNISDAEFNGLLSSVMKIILNENSVDMEKGEFDNSVDEICGKVDEIVSKK